MADKELEIANMRKKLVEDINPNINANNNNNNSNNSKSNNNNNNNSNLKFFKKQSSTITHEEATSNSKYRTNKISSPNFLNRNNYNTNNSNNTNHSNRKSQANFLTEPNDNTSVYSNIRENNNIINNNNLGLGLKSKRTSVDYDNLKFNSEICEVNNLKLNNANVNNIFGKSKPKNASISEFPKNQLTTMHGQYSTCTAEMNARLNNNNNNNNNSNSNVNNTNHIDNINNNSKLLKASSISQNNNKSKNNSNLAVPLVDTANYNNSNKNNFDSNNSEKILNTKSQNVNNNINDNKFSLERNIQSANIDSAALLKSQSHNALETETMPNQPNEELLNGYNYYKSSFDEQKKLMNNEHEIIADSLYDLAVHFLTFKNELLNSIKPTIINNQYNMSVNNFPQDNVNNLRSQTSDNPQLLSNNTYNPVGVNSNTNFRNLISNNNNTDSNNNGNLNDSEIL